MSPKQEDNNPTPQWESAHKCPKCGYDLNLEKLDLQEATTGIATCPRCEWSSQIDIQIVSSQDSDQ
jgi:ssDNA-binding Zn-finger/Zn-ribbon topoisomerase 1